MIEGKTKQTTKQMNKKKTIDLSGDQPDGCLAACSQGGFGSTPTAIGESENWSAKLYLGTLVAPKDAQ
jgi:hypothetical protein